MRIAPVRPELVRQAPPGARVQRAPVDPQDTFTPTAVAAEAPEDRGPRIAGWKRAGMGLMAALSMAGMAAGLAGCSDPAPSTPPSSTVGTDLSYYLMSTQDEVALGQRVAAQIEREVPLWKDPAAQARLDRLAAQLTPHSTRQDITYTFKLLDTDAVNAMAAPGGPIYVTRGMMEFFQDDGELQFILGHEMGHIEQRHAVKEMGRERILDWVAEKVVGNGSRAAEVVGDVAERLLGNQFNQEDELESDRLGQRHLVQVGRSPWVGVRALERMQSLTEAHGSDVANEILSTHPPTRARVEALRELARKVEPDPATR